MRWPFYEELQRLRSSEAALPRFNFFRKSALSCLCCTIYICRSAFPHLLLLPSPNLYLLLLLIENGRLHVQTHERNRPIWNPDISSSICVSLNQDSLERGCSYLCKANLFSVALKRGFQFSIGKLLRSLFSESIKSVE